MLLRVLQHLLIYLVSFRLIANRGSFRETYKDLTPTAKLQGGTKLHYPDLSQVSLS